MTIGVIVIILLLWGPQKIPDIARAIGKAKREFETASKQFQNMANELNNPENNGSSQVQNLPDTMSLQDRQSPTPERTGDEILIETARKLGIMTQGKTREQISQEIIIKGKSAT
jgi:sec-independent protein translocase protein TatA